MAKTQYDLLVEQANKPKKPQTIKAVEMGSYGGSDIEPTIGNIGSTSTSGTRNASSGFMGTQQRQKRATNSFGYSVPSDDVYQTNGESSQYVSGGTGNWGSSKTENIIPDLGNSKKNDYVYTGPNYMDQLRSAYNSIYDSNISAANSAYARLKEEAERQALIKKGQARTRQITMEKYVPETLRAMGLKNNGLAADALIGIDNNYTNYLMQALAQEENMKAEASRFLADQTRAANNQKALWDIDLLGKQQDAWTMMQQMALSGDYDETALQNFGYSWGFDKDQVGSTLDIYKNVLAKEEAEKSKANNSLLASDASTYFNSGLSLERMKMELAQKGYTADQIAIAEKYFNEHEALTVKEGQTANFNKYATNMLNGGLNSIGALLDEAEALANSGELTSTDYGRLEQLYVAKKQKGMGALSASEYESRVQAILNGTYVASKNNEDNNILVEREAKNKAVHYEDLYGVNISDDANVVNINGTSFSSSMFGDYWGTGRENSNQSNYINKIVADAKAGKIKEGQTIKANLGVEFSDYGVYIYLGNGIFIEAPPGATSRGGTLYVPDGYKETAGRVQKK